jgi:hypothetical protein
MEDAMGSMPGMTGASGAAALPPDGVAAVPEPPGTASAPAWCWGVNRIYTNGEIIPIEIPLVIAKPTIRAAVRRRWPR